MHHFIVIYKGLWRYIASQTRLIFNTGFSSILYSFLAILNFILCHSIWHASYLYLSRTFLWLFLYFNMIRSISIWILAILLYDWIFSHYVQRHHIWNHNNWSPIKEWSNDFWGVITSYLTLWDGRFLKRRCITHSVK